MYEIWLDHVFYTMKTCQLDTSVDAHVQDGGLLAREQ